MLCSYCTHIQFYNSHIMGCLRPWNVLLTFSASHHLTRTDTAQRGMCAYTYSNTHSYVLPLVIHVHTYMDSTAVTHMSSLFIFFFLCCHCLSFSFDHCYSILISHSHLHPTFLFCQLLCFCFKVWFINGSMLKC